jgi:hypothetical protein
MATKKPPPVKGVAARVILLGSVELQVRLELVEVMVMVLA